MPQKSSDWVRDVQDTLTAEIQRAFLKKDIQTLQEVFQEVNNSGKLQDLLTNASSEIRIDPDKCRFTLRGFGPDVQNDYAQFEALVDEMEKKLKRKRESVRESTQVGTFKSDFLKANGFEAAVKAKYPQLNVTVEVSEIRFHGLVEDIKFAKLILFEEFLDKQVTVEYKLPPAVLNLLKTKPTHDIVFGQFSDANIRAVWDVGESQLKVSALSQEAVDKGWNLLEKAVVQTPVIPDQGESNYHEVLKLAKWQEKKQQLESQYDGLLSISESDGQLVITCVAGICDMVKEEIHGFLTDNVILEQLVRVELPMAKAVDKLCKDDIRKLIEKWRSCRCDITLSHDPDSPGFVVKATKPGIANIMNDVKTQMLKLESQVIAESGGRAKFFRSPHGNTNLEGIALRHNAVICPVVTSNQDAHTTTNQIALPTQQHSIEKYSYKGVMIKVASADLTKYRADAIVNAANNQLEHVGGLAKAIVDAGWCKPFVLILHIIRLYGYCCTVNYNGKFPFKNGDFRT